MACANYHRTNNVFRNVGMVFQSLALWPHKCVVDHLRFALTESGLSPGEKRERIAEILQKAKLGGKDRRFPHELSGGEQQRLAIARAVVSRPPVVALG